MGGSIVFNDKIGADEKPAFRPLVYICAPYSGDVEENKKLLLQSFPMKRAISR